MEDKITIHQLAGKLVAELKKCGFSECTIWQCYMPCVSSIERYYEKLGQVYYDPVVTDEYLSFQAERVKRGEIAGCFKYLQAGEKLLINYTVCSLPMTAAFL